MATRVKVTLADFQRYLSAHANVFVEITRMRYSGGIMCIVTVDKKFSIRWDEFYTRAVASHYTESTEDEYREYLNTVIRKYIITRPPHEDNIRMEEH